jgi:hypothetical protein
MIESVPNWGKRGRMPLSAACYPVQKASMAPTLYANQAPDPPLACHRSLAHTLHLDALTVVGRLY